MNILEKQMVEALIDLKDNHNVIGVKAEFEAEGTRMEEALRLKEVVSKAGLNLSVKIGGCEALKDIYDAKIIGTEAILAPMIESPYALKKYINAVMSAFSPCERDDVKFMINIETQTGHQNLNKIVDTPEFEEIDGITLGRFDMACSLGMTKEDVNSEIMLDIAKDLAKECFGKNKIFTIGGGVSAGSIPFFKKIDKNSLQRFETRKIIFDAQKAIDSFNPELSVEKALEFELMWLKNKRDFYNTILKEDAQRLVSLETRCLNRQGGTCV